MIEICWTQSFFAMLQRYHYAIFSASPALEIFMLTKIMGELEDCQFQRTAKVWIPQISLQNISLKSAQGLHGLAIDKQDR